MSREVVAIGVLALALSALLTKAIRRWSLQHGLLDIPNARSSHVAATPRGGGWSIVIASTAAWLLLRWIGAISTELLLALIGGGGAVAVVGFVDDRRRLPPGIRLTVHAAAAVWALLWLGGLPPLQIGQSLLDLGWAGHALALLGIVWTLNLFNFMDGIDGIAASEAVFIAASGALLGLMPAALVFAAACMGFLLWNWPPARIFMGDVGSGYLGFVISVLALSAIGDDHAGLWIWLILGAVFFADATVTLARRALRRERLHEAHRSHGYQRLARRWRSHRRVTLAVMIVNLIWLLPCALLAVRYPTRAALIALGALTPLFLLAVIIGAGRRESAAV